MDKAVTSLRRFWLFCSLASTVAIGSAPLPGLHKVAFLVVSVFMLAATEYGFRRVLGDEHFSIIYATLAAYLWFAYPGKLALMLYESDSSWINTIPFVADPAPSDLTAAFFHVAPALIALLVGLVAGVSSRSPTRGSTLLRAKFAVWIAALLVLKVVLQAKWSIAVPGVQPKAFAVPFLVGGLAFSVGLPLAALVNIYLFHALLDEDRTRIKVGLLLALGLVISDLWVGYKMALMMQAVVMWFYWLAVKHRTSSPTRRLLGAFLAINVLGMVVLYKYVNEYRFALLGGVDVRSAIRAAGSPPSAHRIGSLFSIVSRINGIDNYYVATKMASVARYEIGTLFNQDLGSSFNQVLFSGNDVNTNFGLTQFGALHVVGGLPLAILGAFVIGWAVRLNSRFVLGRVVGDNSWAIAFTPLLALWYMRVLFAGGELTLFAKELAVACLMLAGFRRLSSLSTRRLAASRGVSDPSTSPANEPAAFR